MSVLSELLLGIHVVAGFLALFAGGGALATKKGGRRHRRLGRIFVYAMAVVSGTAVALLPIEVTGARVFLTFVAVFSFYFAFSGYRALSRKRPDDGPGRLDWLAVVLLLGSGVGMGWTGLAGPFAGTGFAPVVLTFAAIAVAFAANDARGFSTPSNGTREWFYEHLVRMSAAYIATVSAFSAVNFLFLPGVVRWLWPTLVGTPLIAYWTRRYRKRFETAASSG
jgi:hypothetical protein